jgi:hypothetical protein
VGDPRAFGVEGVGATPGAVYELVADHEVAGPDVLLEGAGGGRGQHSLHAQLLEGPEVGAVVDGRRRQRVLRAVAGQERDLLPLYGADRDRRRRLAVRGVDLDLTDVVEQPVEAGAAEDAYACQAPAS